MNYDKFVSEVKDRMSYPRDWSAEKVFMAFFHEVTLANKDLVEAFSKSMMPPALDENEESPSCTRCHGWGHIEQGGNDTDCPSCDGDGVEKNYEFHSDVLGEKVSDLLWESNHSVFLIGTIEGLAEEVGDISREYAYEKLLCNDGEDLPF